MDCVLLKFELPPAASFTSSTDHPEPFQAAPPSVTGNLAHAFFEIAQARAGHPAIETAAGAFSYSSILHAAERVRAYLCARPNHAPGIRVVLKLSNSPEYLAAFYGALLADCVVAPLPVKMEKLRLQNILDICRPDVVMTSPEDLAREDTSSFCELHLGAPAGGQIARPKLRRGGDDMAMLLFTSGSTGAPKGVMLSHRNVIANTRSILQSLPIRSDDRALMLLPFCHSFGNSILQTHMLAGATLAVGGMLAFPQSVVEALAKSGATTFSGIPEAYNMLVRYGRLGETALPKLRYMSVAGGELRSDVADQIAARIAPATFHVMYGQSEATARLSMLPPEQRALRRRSIGKPLPGIEFSIRDDSGRELEPGAVGMLHARGDNVMLGYWQDEGATAEVLGSDGWLRTGDLGHRDPDNYFYLDGRANLLVKIQGYRVHPAEIEDVVEANFPHARAIALPMVRGDETRFALFLAPQGDGLIDVAEIRATCIRELPAYKVPLYFEVLDHLPLTSAYKVDRAALSLRVPQH